MKILVLLLAVCLLIAGLLGQVAPLREGDVKLAIPSFYMKQQGTSAAMPSSGTAFMPVTPDSWAMARSDQSSAREEKKVAMQATDSGKGLSRGTRLIQVQPAAKTTAHHRRVKSGPAPHVVGQRQLSPVKEDVAAEMVIQQYLDPQGVRDAFKTLVVNNEWEKIVPFWESHKTTLNVYDMYGVDKESILHCALTSEACKQDKAAGMVHFLVAKAGDCLSSRNRLGRTPLHCAVWEGFDVAVQIILKEINAIEPSVDCKNPQDLYLEARDKDGRTPMHFAAKLGDKTIASLLLASGADINALDNDCKTPLYFAVADQRHEVVTWLVMNKANLLLTDNQGNTILHAAASVGDAVIMAYLLGECNALKDVKNKQGKTPYDIAVHQGMVVNGLAPSCCGGCCVIQ